MGARYFASAVPMGDPFRLNAITDQASTDGDHRDVMSVMQGIGGVTIVSKI